MRQRDGPLSLCKCERDEKPSGGPILGDAEISGIRKSASFLDGCGLCLCCNSNEEGWEDRELVLVTN